MNRESDVESIARELYAAAYCKDNWNNRRVVKKDQREAYLRAARVVLAALREEQSPAAVTSGMCRCCGQWMHGYHLPDCTVGGGVVTMNDCGALISREPYIVTERRRLLYEGREAKWRRLLELYSQPIDELDDGSEARELRRDLGLDR